MTAKPVVGFVGVGLMGHGLAKNILAKGWPLVFFEHPGNRPTDDLRALQARSLDSLVALAREAEIIVLCVTGAPQVEAVVLGEGGLLAGLASGKTLIDCSTSIPDTTLRIAAAASERGVRFLDAPLTRTPKEAEEGRANVLVGGEAAVFEDMRPLFAAFAENVVHVGPVGAGHRMKLLHNYVSLGFTVLLAEAAVAARRGGTSMQTFIDVLAKGGGDGVALRRMAPYLTEADTTALRFSLANARKDLTYYLAMADALDVPSFAAHAVQQVVAAAVSRGAGEEPLPKLVDLIAGEWAGEPQRRA